jgi:TrmH family RNA methyltransferase
LNAKGRTGQSAFLAEGIQAVREALRIPGMVRRLFVAKESVSPNDELLAMADLNRVPVATAPAKLLSELSDTVNSQGIIAVCGFFGTQLEDITDPKLVVFGAQMRDPGNVGTLIRCADAFGADAVLLSDQSVDLYNPKTVRASVGSLFHLPVIQEIGFGLGVLWAHSHGLQVWAADAGGQPLSTMGNALRAPTLWAFGNEAWGFRPEDLALCDAVVSVPMWGAAESLNVTTAAAVCLYESAVAQRSSH